MKVLLIGELFSHNLGDQLIYYCTKRAVLSIDSQAQFVLLDIMGRKQSTVENNAVNYDLLEGMSTRTPLWAELCKNSVLNYLIKSKSLLGLQSYYKSLITPDIDVAIITGGALIQDTFAVYLDAIMKLLKRNNIPVIFNAVGVGRKSWITKRILIRMLKRDNISGFSCRCLPERFDEIIPKERTKVISSYDIAVFCGDAFDLSSEKNYTVGLGIMNFSRFSQQQLIDFWVDVIHDLDERGVGWKVFTTGSPEDGALAVKIIKNIYAENYRNKIVIPANVEELITIIHSFDRILSFRLHSHIIAYALRIPSVGIVWDSKVSDFFNKINRGDSIFDITDPTDKIISSLIAQEPISSEELLKVKEHASSVFFTLLNKALKRIEI